MSTENETRKYYNRIIKILTPLTRLISRNRVEGLHNIPLEGGVIIAPNHISNIDPVLVGVKLATRRQVHALAKESLFRAPIVGSVLKNMGHIPVHRGGSTAGESLKAAKSMIEAGGAVAIYPEGTIPKTSSGELGPFKTGVARLAKETDVPVIPVGQWGAQNVMPVGKNPVMSVLKAVFTKPDQVAVIGEPMFRSMFSSPELFTEKLKENIKTLTIEAQRLTTSRNSDR